MKSKADAALKFFCKPTDREPMSNVALTKDLEKADGYSAKRLLAFKNLEKRLEAILQEEGPKSRISFGFMVLQCVVQGNYDRALTELDSVEKGINGYPEFKEKAERYVEHAKSLVLAIKTKKTIGMSPHINRSKQKELGDKITEHFADLKRCIIIVEKIEKGIRAKDLGSTILVFKVIYYSSAAIVIGMLLNFMRPDLGVSFFDIISYFFWPE